jgi:hypothetical protein
MRQASIAKSVHDLGDAAAICRRRMRRAKVGDDRLN